MQINNSFSKNLMSTNNILSTAVEAGYTKLCITKFSSLMEITFRQANKQTKPDEMKS